MRLEFGTPVCCRDGPFGELADVVIDPTSRRVTHLVVQPHHRHGLARLVPVEEADAARGADSEVLLRCSIEEVRRMELVQAFAYLQLGEFPIADPDWDVGVESVLALPYYDSSGMGGYATDYPMDYDPRVGISYDRIPKGEVEIRRTSTVCSADGHDLGRVDGFLVDAGEQITHLVLEHGHLWGRRDVTITIGAVTKVQTDAVTLSLTKDAVEALPAVPVNRWKTRREQHGQ